MTTAPGCPQRSDVDATSDDDVLPGDVAGTVGGEEGGYLGDLACGAESDVGAADVAATLAGILVVAGAPDQRAQAARMLNLVLDGLRPGAAGDLSRA
jgi:hypothetical protein